MIREGLSIGFSPAAAQAAAETRDLVLLEQEAYGAYNGRLTRANMLRYLDYVSYSQPGAAAPSFVDCGGAGGAKNELPTAILVYPLAEGVRYRLYCTIGQLGQAAYAEVEEQDTVTFGMATEVSIRHPARRVIDAQWLTGPWTTGGRRIDPPPLFADSRTLRSRVPVFGSVRVVLLVPRWRHALSIPWPEARKKLQDNEWNEWAVCLPPPGRPVALELTASLGARDMASTGAECGMGNFKVKEAEPEWPPEAEPENKYLDCDYCTGECEGEDEQGGHDHTV